VRSTCHDVVSKTSNCLQVLTAALAPSRLKCGSEHKGIGVAYDSRGLSIPGPRAALTVESGERHNIRLLTHASSCLPEDGTQSSRQRAICPQTTAWLAGPQVPQRQKWELASNRQCVSVRAKRHRQHSVHALSVDLR